MKGEGTLLVVRAADFRACSCNNEMLRRALYNVVMNALLQDIY
jgi:hypothetical protein